jgi:heat shock protein HslJ
MKSSWHSLAILITSLIPIAACGATVDNASRADEGTTPSGAPIASAMEESRGAEARSSAVPADLLGEWTLVALDGEPVPEVGKNPTLEILEDGSAAGVSGVNRFRTQLELADGRLDFGPLAGTKMAGPPEAMALESDFLARLDAASTYQVEGDTLRLWAGDNEALTFARMKAEE